MFYTAIKYEKGRGWILNAPRREFKSAMGDRNENHDNGYKSCVIKTAADLRDVSRALTLCNHMTNRRKWMPDKLMLDFTALDFHAVDMG